MVDDNRYHARLWILRFSGAKTLFSILMSLLVPAWCFVHVSAGYAVEDNDALADQVLDAMWHRSERINSFIIEWEESASTVRDNAAERYISESKAATSSADAAFALDMARSLIATEQGGVYRMVADGPKLRFEQSTFEPDRADPNQVAPQTSVAAYNGSTSEWVSSENSGNYPVGGITANSDPTELRFLVATPPVLAYRAPLWLERQGERDAFLAKGTWGTLDEKRVAILTLSPSDTDRSSYVLWCDPDLDFLALRLDIMRNSSLRRRWDFSYELNEPTGEWVLLGWRTIALRPNGGLQNQKSSEVIQCSVNAAVPQDEFDVKFPVGTYVKDEIAGTTYILRDHGRERIISPVELKAGMSYQELLHSEHSTGQVSRWIATTIILCTSALVALIAFWAYYINKRRSASCLKRS